MNKKTLSALTISGTILVLAATGAQAHYPWVSPHEYQTPNGNMTFHIGWGHVFPVDGQLGAERIREVMLTSGDGERMIVDTESGSEFSIQLVPGGGAYMLTMTQNRSPYSQTREGGQGGSRATLDGVLSCSQSVNAGKALIGGGVIMDQPVHHPLEIIPMTDPSILSVGDYFPIQVLWHDEPYQGEVVATYSSYGTSSGQYPVSVNTDANGMAEILLSQADEWMFKVTATSDYYDQSICDTNGYLATLTFEIN